MRLLITRFGGSNRWDTEEWISLVDTDYPNSESQFPIYNFSSSYQFQSVTGVDYSGNWLCVGVNGTNKHSYLFLFDFIDNRNRIVPLENYPIWDIVSVFPGQLYINTENSIVNVSLSDSGELQDETIHYKLPGYQKNFRSLCTYRMRWYGGIENAIVEFSNGRVIYSDLVFPSSLFFNSFNRLCFIDRTNIFVAGDDVFYLDGQAWSVIEDCGKAGYWFHAGDELVFMDYSGNFSNEMKIGAERSVRMVEARGTFNDYFETN
jgi:hypothetical protein